MHLYIPQYELCVFVFAVDILPIAISYKLVGNSVRKKKILLSMCVSVCVCMCVVWVTCNM